MLFNKDLLGLVLTRVEARTLASSCALVCQTWKIASRKILHDWTIELTNPESVYSSVIRTEVLHHPSHFARLFIKHWQPRFWKSQATRALFLRVLARLSDVEWRLACTITLSRVDGSLQRDPLFEGDVAKIEKIEFVTPLFRGFSYSYSGSFRSNPPEAKYETFLFRLGDIKTSSVLWSMSRKVKWFSVSIATTMAELDMLKSVAVKFGLQEKSLLQILNACRTFCVPAHAFGQGEDGLEFERGCLVRRHLMKLSP